MSTDLEAFVQEAQRAYRAGDAAKALTLLEEATRRFPDAPEAWNHRMTLNQLEGRVDDALACAERFAALAPGRSDAWFMKGRVLQDAGRLEEAARAYGKATEIDPKDVDSWVNWGCVLDDTDQPAEAVQRYDRALALNPDEAMAWGNRGNSLLALGRNEEALASYDRALSLGHDSIASGRCECLLALGRIDEANRARPRGPRDPGEARERRHPVGDRSVVARYFIGGHSNPELLDAAVEGLVADVAACAGRPPGLGEGIRIAMGWPVLTIRERGGDYVVCEPDWFRDPQRSLREHVSFSAMQLVMMQLTHDLTRLEVEPCHCHDRIALQPGALEAEQVVLRRVHASKGGESGWVVAEEGRDVDEAGVARVPMSRLVAVRAHLLKVASLPVGTTVRLRGHAVESIVDARGEERLTG